MHSAESIQLIGLGRASGHTVVVDYKRGSEKNLCLNMEDLDQLDHHLLGI